MNIAIIGYRDVCVCGHEGLVTGLASSKVQIDWNISLKKKLTSKEPPVWSERLSPSALPNPLVTNLILLFDQ